MFLQAEEYVNARSNWVGCLALRSEVRVILTLYNQKNTIQGEDDLCDWLEPLNQGTGGEEGVTGEEDEFHEWTELECTAMASALGVLA